MAHFLKMINPVDMWNTRSIWISSNLLELMFFKCVLLKNTVLGKEYSTFSQHVDKVVSPRSGDFWKYVSERWRKPEILCRVDLIVRVSCIPIDQFPWRKKQKTKMSHNLPRMEYLITYLESREWAKLIVSGRETTNQLQAPLRGQTQMTLVF